MVENNFPGNVFFLLREKRVDKIPLGGMLGLMQQDFQNRLRRLEGQIRALQTLTQASDCKKTIIQFQAAQAALDKCFANYLQRNLQECLKQKQTQKLDEILHSLTQQ